MANFTIHILFIIHLRWMARSVQSATGYIACEMRKIQLGERILLVNAYQVSLKTDFKNVSTIALW